MLCVSVSSHSLIHTLEGKKESLCTSGSAQHWMGFVGSSFVFQALTVKPGGLACAFRLNGREAAWCVCVCVLYVNNVDFVRFKCVCVCETCFLHMMKRWNDTFIRAWYRLTVTLYSAIKCFDRPKLSLLSLFLSDWWRCFFKEGSHLF